MVSHFLSLSSLDSSVLRMSISFLFTAVSTLTVVVLHVPKTAGTAVRSTFSACNASFPKHSVRLASLCKRTDEHVITVLRDPYDRLFSAFTYFKYGSTLWHSRPAGKRATNLTFAEFIEAWADDQHAKHDEAVRITSRRNWTHTPWVWSDHFAPQSSWWHVPYCPQPVHFLCFSSNLLDAAANLFHDLGVRCPTRAPTRVNPTLKNNEVKLEFRQLSAAAQGFLHSRYRQDMKTYNTLCAS